MEALGLERIGAGNLEADRAVGGVLLHRVDKATVAVKNLIGLADCPMMMVHRENGDSQAVADDYRKSQNMRQFQDPHDI